MNEKQYILRWPQRAADRKNRMVCIWQQCQTRMYFITKPLHCVCKPYHKECWIRFIRMWSENCWKEHYPFEICRGYHVSGRKYWGLKPIDDGGNKEYQSKITVDHQEGKVMFAEALYGFKVDSEDTEIVMCVCVEGVILHFHCICKRQNHTSKRKLRICIFLMQPPSPLQGSFPNFRKAM